MSAMIYILKRSFVNIIKGILKKPVILITYIIIAVFFIGIFIITRLSGNSGKSNIDKDIAGAVIVAYILFVFVITVFSSLAGGASFFRLADVNLLFTAPVKAGNILIYGFVKQLAINVIFMFFLASQYPNWKKIFGLIDGAGIILVLGNILMIILSSFLGIFLYSFVSKKPGRRGTVKIILYVALIFFLLPLLIKAIENGNIIKSGIDYFSSDIIKYMPVIGWFREFMMGVFNGIDGNFILNFSLFLLVCAALFIYIYKMDTGYYEDVLVGSEKNEILAKVYRGKPAAVFQSIRKYRKVKFSFTMEGSKAVFQRQLLEQRKTGIWYLSVKSFVLFMGAIIVSLIVKADGNIIISGILAASAYIIMIFNIIGSWSGELSKHYIYIIPASPFSKMVYSTLPDVIKYLIEGIFIFTIPGIVTGTSILTISLAIITYISIGAVFLYSDLFIRRIYSSIHVKIMRIFFRIIIMVVITPAIIMSVIIIAISGNYALAFFAASLINLIFITIFMLIGVEVFSNPEYDL